MPEPLALTFLNESRLFGGLGRPQTAALAAACRFRDVARGEVLFRQGDPGDSYYILAEGSATLSVLSEDGHELIVHVAQAGDSFGEVALLDGLSRSATCTIREPGRIMTLRREPFLALLADPQIARRIIDALCGMLRAANHKAEMLAHRPLRARLADALLTHARPGAPPALRITQQELADICGATRPRVNRAMKELEASGMIRKAGRMVLLLADPAALARLAGETHNQPGRRVAGADASGGDI